MSQRTALRFLGHVWGLQHRREGRTLFVSAKDWESGSWEDLPHVGGKLVLPTLDDLYFCPNYFTGKRRLEADACPTRWLHADLDEVDPETIASRLRPTVAWETSPGRFQALWLLERPLSVANFATVNQKLTYYVQADSGGWSITKVLRVPGTYNNKPDYDRFLVRPLWTDGPTYTGSDIYSRVKRTDTPYSVSRDLPEFKPLKASAARIRKRHASKLTIETRRLLKEPVAVGGRSEAMWKLLRLLAEAGVPARQAYVLAQAAPCNKFKGQRREQERLWTEITKAYAVTNGKSKKRSAAGTSRRAAIPSNATAKPSSSSPSSTRTSRKKEPAGSKRRSTRSTSDSRTERIFASDNVELRDIRPTDYDDFIRAKFKRKMWTVEGVWAEKAHGLIAGEAKTYKSLLTMDLAVSVASGTRFLDHFKIPKTGPVLLIQEENDKAEVQERLEAIALSKTLGEKAKVVGNRIRLEGHRSLPIKLVNNEQINITDLGDLALIERWIRRQRPALMVLDPWYLLTPGVDENVASQVTPVMDNLRKLKQTYDVGILIVHHYNKSSAENPRKARERVSGSSVFDRWFESMLTLEREEEEATVKVQPYHRSHGPQPNIHVTFDIDRRHYAVSVEKEINGTQLASAEKQIAEIVQRNGGKATLAQLQEELGVARNTVRARVEDAGLLVVAGKQNGKRVSFVKTTQK